MKRRVRLSDYGAIITGFVSGMMVAKYGKTIYYGLFPPSSVRNWEEKCDQLECECNVESDMF